MVSCTSAFVAAAILAVASAASNSDPGHPTTESPKKCYILSERCAGAENFPFVKYLPCCGENSCTKKDTSDGGYGYLCEAPTKCYELGQKCIGSKRFPLVPFRPCCGLSTCSKKATDWGYVCEAPPKCRDAGAKCAGAKGYPAIPWIPCCTGYTCAGKASDWGLVCVKIPPSAHKCYKKGEDCSGAKKCCDKLVCAKSVCALAPTEAPTMTVTPEKCIKWGEKCGFPQECCEGFSCYVYPFGPYCTHTRKF